MKKIKVFFYKMPLLICKDFADSQNILEGQEITSAQNILYHKYIDNYIIKLLKTTNY
jgi:hypothetical protein